MFTVLELFCSRRNSNSSFGHNSLPVDLSDGLYQNGKVFAEDTHIGRPLR